MPRRLPVFVAVALFAVGCRPSVFAPSTAPAPFPPDLVLFAPAADVPVFAAAPGQWDAAIRERGWVLHDGGVWKLWYTGYDGTKTGRRRLGYATSPDGLSWTRHPGNPLLPDVWVEDVQVVKDGGRHVMFAEGENDRAQLLTSPDGVAWTRVGRLDVRTTTGEPIADGPYGTPTAWVENGKWHLLYERNDAGVWLATSDDLAVWRNARDEPVLVPGPAAFDKDMIAVNQVVRRGGRYYAYYHGCATTGPDAKTWSVGIARSDDLLHWEKYVGNPLTPPAANRSSGIVVDDGAGRLRMYTTHPAVYVYQPMLK